MTCGQKSAPDVSFFRIVLIPVVNDVFGEHHPKDAECEEILSRLEEALSEEPEVFQDLLRLIRRVTEHLLTKQDELKRKVETVMGGKVLELPSDKLREERAAGIAEGVAASILDLLEDVEPVPEDLRESIHAISENDILRKLLKLAARAGSLEEFEKNASD